MSDLGQAVQIHERLARIEESVTHLSALTSDTKLIMERLVRIEEHRDTQSEQVARIHGRLDEIDAQLGPLNAGMAIRRMVERGVLVTLGGGVTALCLFAWETLTGMGR